jgi:hypothetical protein
MLHNSRFIVRFIATAILVGAFAPIANAGPVGNLHPTFAAKQTKIVIVPIKLFNKGDIPESVKVAGDVYMIAPHSFVTFKAPKGTQVIADTAGKGFNKGDVLFAVSPEMKDETVLFN